VSNIVYDSKEFIPMTSKSDVFKNDLSVLLLDFGSLLLLLLPLLLLSLLDYICFYILIANLFIFLFRSLLYTEESLS
jgi:hypothetical protein